MGMWTCKSQALKAGTSSPNGFAGGGEVVARAREHQDKAEYVVPLFLPSNYSHQPTNPMPIWFDELLQAKGGGYHTLAEVAHALDNPVVFAEVERYHCHHKGCAELEANW